MPTSTDALDYDITVALASASPAKCDAVVLGFAQLGLRAEVIPIGDLPTGVPAQPVGDKQTRTGAMNRCKGALQRVASGAVRRPDLCVAIEGGLQDDYLKDFAWIVIASPDAPEQLSSERSSTMAIPRELAARVKAGEELGHAADWLASEHGVGEAGAGKGDQGVLGMMTCGTLTRGDHYAPVIHLALLPFMQPALFGMPIVAPLAGWETRARLQDVSSYIAAARAEAACEKERVKAAPAVAGWQEHKASGTEAFKAGDYAAAASAYSQAIKLIDQEAEAANASLLYSNRATANMRLAERSEDAAGRRRLAMRISADALTAVDLDPSNAKGHLRAGQAALFLAGGSAARLKNAVESLKAAKTSGALAGSLQEEAEMCYRQALAALDDEVDMPEGCAVM